MAPAFRICLRATRRLMNFQVAAVYLLSKDGILERRAIDGIDKRGRPIGPDWYTDEAYKPGEGFTASVILPSGDTAYGQPAWSTDLEREALNPKGRVLYRRKLGILQSAISVPLNGLQQSYGALEVVNKLRHDKSIDPNPQITQEDINWVSIIALVIASTITGIRSRHESFVLGEISQVLAKTYEDQYLAQPGAIYERILRLIVGPLLPFQAAVLRILNAAGVLEVMAKVGDNVDWTRWKDVPITKGSWLAGIVYEEQRYAVVPNIEEEKGKFANLDWVRANGIKSCGCFPLTSEGKLVGTLSVYTGHVHRFSARGIGLLGSLTSSLAFFAVKARIASELKAVRAELESQQQAIVRAAHQAAYNESTQRFLHQNRSVLVNTLGWLDRLRSAASDAGRKRIISVTRGWINTQIRRVDRQFDAEGTKYSRTNLNQLVRDAIRYFSLQSRGKPIEVVPRLSLLPDIRVNEVEVQDVIYNLLSNATRAVEESRRGRGRIIVSTGLARLAGIEYIQLVVRDNGVGIKVKDAKQIYDKRFSTYKAKGGRGLGLFIAKGIVERYDGRIEFQSKVGRGSRFTVRLPKERLLA